MFHLDVKKIICLVIELRLLQLKNLNLNKIIKNFTSSQQNLNKLVGNLGNHSFGHGVGFQRDVIRTKPKRANCELFQEFSKKSHFLIMIVMLNV